MPLSAFGQGGPQRWQTEGRIETLISRTTAVHAAVGANAIAGTYMRVAVLGAAGARHIAGAWRPSGRIDIVGRFHVDPHRQFSVGLYVVGGATALLDDGARTRIRAVVGAGMESRALGSGSGWIVGVEGGFGGGGRLAATLRRARRNAR
jgi:hypothetical protein